MSDAILVGQNSRPTELKLRADFALKQFKVSVSCATLFVMEEA